MCQINVGRYPAGSYFLDSSLTWLINQPHEPLGGPPLVFSPYLHTLPLCSCICLHHNLRSPLCFALHFFPLPFGAFQPKFHWFRTRNIDSQRHQQAVSYSTSWKERTETESVPLPFTHCAMCTVDDSSLMALVPLRTSGSTAGFTRENPVQN